MEVVAIPAARLAPADRDAIVALCSAAYEEPFAVYLDMFADPVHIITQSAGRIISHACIVTRWVQPAGHRPLRTAYVEAVATLPGEQGNGHASRILAAIPALVADFEIAALSPSEAGFYARLGWESWLGPLAVRMADRLEASIDEEVMILRLPLTPPLDLSALLSIEFRDGEIW
jgi:GNAT superfamily N-acetyltransferase